MSNDINKEAIDVLGTAMNEIQSLRRENEILRAKVSVIDVFAKALNPVYVSKGETGRVDPLWEIGRFRDKVVAVEKAADRLQGKMEAAQQGGLQGSPMPSEEEMQKWLEAFRHG